jgi:hypothetical protein
MAFASIFSLTSAPSSGSHATVQCFCRRFFSSFTQSITGKKRTHHWDALVPFSRQKSCRCWRLQLVWHSRLGEDLHYFSIAFRDSSLAYFLCILPFSFYKRRKINWDMLIGNSWVHSFFHLHTFCSSPFMSTVRLLNKIVIECWKLLP